MCGIVGYVGEPTVPRPADRRAREARVPRLRLGRHLAARGRPRSRPCARSATSPTCAQAGGIGERRRRRGRRARRRRSASRTPAGRPTAGSPRRTPTRTATAPAGSTSCSTGSSRTTPSCAATSTAEGHAFSSETDAEIVAHLIERHYDGDLTEAVRGRVRRAARPLRVRRHARRRNPSTLVAARKECPLVVGLGDGETFVASAIPAFLAETRTALRARERRDRHRRPRRRADHRRRRDAGRARGRGGHLGRGRGREGRLPDLHAQGDPRAGRRGRRDDRRPAARARLASTSPSSSSPTTSSGASGGS